MSPARQPLPWNVESLYTRYHRSVFTRALAILRAEDKAMDAAQEVFLRILNGDREILGVPQPMGWLYRVTTNLCLNKLRDSERRQRLLRENFRDEAVAPDAESRTLVQEILGALSPPLREVAVMFYVHRMTQDEIAASIGVSRRTVCYRLDAVLRLFFTSSSSFVRGTAPTICPTT